MFFPLSTSSLRGQSTSFPFVEKFDSVTAPRLPSGWSTSALKAPSGDFATSTSTPFSGQNAVVSTDARVAQSLTSPMIDFSGKIAGTLEFYERRTSSHNSGLIVEALINNDTASAIQLGDTLRNSGNTNYVLRSLPIPPEIKGQPNVRFRWRIVGNGSGATGTLRIDDVKATVQKQIDLAVTNIQVQPMNVRSGGNLILEAGVANRALQGTFFFTLQLFDDRNFDSYGSTDEKIDEQTFSRSFEAAESTVFTLNYPVVFAGLHRLIVSLTLAGDEDSTNNVLSKSIFVGYPLHSILINEIMYAPLAGPEWIECINNSPDTISLADWKIGDNTASRVTLSSQAVQIAPHQLFVVTKDSSIIDYFPSIVVPVVKASFPTLNNDFDAVVIADPTGVAVDSVAYSSSWGGLNGMSLERVDYFSSSVDSANWRSASPTPGRENSVAKKDFDLTITNVMATLMNGGIRLTAVVRNVGRNAAAAFTVQFYRDANGDSIVSTGELLHNMMMSGLAPGDSTIAQFDWPTTLRGRIPIVVTVDFSGDQRIDNNARFLWASNTFEPQSVVINEIMYEPLAGRPEFIELFNRSMDTLDLQGWKIMDAPSNSGSRAIVEFSNAPLHLPPGAFLIVAGDSTLLAQFPSLRDTTKNKIVTANKDLSLNNSGDDIVLLDLTSAQIDSVRYSPSWHNPLLNTATAGKSLERINPSLGSNDRRNWSTSVAPQGATPGEPNSIFTMTVPTAAHLTLSPNPFTPHNDGLEDFLVIGYSLPSHVSMIRVRCFDVQGRLIRTIANNEPAASAGSIIWNGLDDNNRRVRVGMYIILFEALDAAGGVVHVMKDVAVVATKL